MRLLAFPSRTHRLDRLKSLSRTERAVLRRLETMTEVQRARFVGFLEGLRAAEAPKTEDS